MSTTYSFSIPPTLVDDLEYWFQYHDCTARRYDILGPVPLALTFCFTETGIGTVIMVKCPCGSSLDLSEYEKW